VGFTGHVRGANSSRARPADGGEARTEDGPAAAPLEVTGPRARSTTEATPRRQNQSRSRGDYFRCVFCVETAEFLTTFSVLYRFLLAPLRCGPTGFVSGLYGSERCACWLAVRVVRVPGGRRLSRA